MSLFRVYTFLLSKLVIVLVQATWQFFKLFAVHVHICQTHSEGKPELLYVHWKCKSNADIYKRL